MTCESYISPNVEWSQEPSTWFGQSLLTATSLFILCQIFSKPVAWSIAIFLYNTITFIFFHAILGDPFNQEYSGMSFWEQLMIQLNGSSGMTFFTVFPIFLFLLAARLAQFSNILFALNFLSLATVITPKILVYMKYYNVKNTRKEQEKKKAAKIR